MEAKARALLCDLMAWHPPPDATSWQGTSEAIDLHVLLQRTIELVGPTIVVHLSTDPALAREKLIDAVAEYLEGCG